MKGNMFPSLLLLLFLSTYDQVQSIVYRIEFDSSYVPPATVPRIAKNMVYSVPLNQVISKPIVARVKDYGNKIVKPEGNPDVKISSLDVSLLTNPSANDVWKQTGGMLCQRTRFGVNWPERFDRNTYVKKCGSSESSSVLITKFTDDMIILDWLSHEHPSGMLPDNLRFLRISIPGMKLTADTNPFNITVPAASLLITQQPPQTVIANTPFNISAEIRDSKDQVITEGLASILYVELTVSYEYKKFYHASGKDMIIASTNARLGGAININQATYDRVMRIQASDGKVTFTDVRILDIIHEVRLNLTMYMSNDPWLRAPDCTTCYADTYMSEKIITFGLVQFKPVTKALLRKTPAVSLTNMFKVTPQTLATLFLHSPFKATEKITITRNFELPGPMFVEARDINGNRIYSGPHGNLPLEITTYPRGVCISKDITTYILEGYGKLRGSICQLMPSVYLNIYSMVNVQAAVNSSIFNVVGDIHLGHFDNFRYSGMGININPHLNTFIKLAAQDINSGTIPGILKQYRMKIIVDTIETLNDRSRTNNIYSNFRVQSQREPSKGLRGIILPTNRDMAISMMRETDNDKIPMISITQRSEEFKDYQYFNRICWNWNQIIISFLIAARDRGWTKVCILRMENEIMPLALHKFSDMYGIRFDEDVHISLFDPRNPVNEMLDEIMEEVISLNTRIIIPLINGTYMLPILSAAHAYGLSANNGYQWIFLSDYARQFPVNKFCAPNIKCSSAFKGSLLLTEVYNISHFGSPHWTDVLSKFLNVDRAIYMGEPAYYPDNDAGAFMALGYDAVWLFAGSIHRIVSKRLTANGLMIVQHLRKLTLNGLTGVLNVDNSGDRSGYTGIIKTLNPELENEIQLIRYIARDANGIQIEFKFGVAPKVRDPSTNLSLLNIAIPTSSVYNLRAFNSYSGGLDEDTYQFIRDKSEPWPPSRIQRFENVVPQHLCKNSCGRRLTIQDANSYDRGTCVSMNKCECFFGFYGESCSEIMCSCLYGHCYFPFKCTCDKGWSGKNCDIPICSVICKNGKCTEPEKCTCESMFWIDAYCSIHIASIVVPLILAIITIIYLVYSNMHRLKTYLERRTALSNLSWVVSWSDVATEEATTGSSTSIIASFYVWNKEKWYVKFFNSKTIDVSDPRVRADMVDLVTLHHKNLINYGGACLTYPHVCLLLEPAMKGSLENILVNESIQLDWNFRFSFIKDICCGMNFLHTKTDLPSHGRLKSSNCLLDNRWTVRLSGFGVPTIRYGPYSIWVNEENSDAYQDNQLSLFWTAPEILRTVSSLDGVRMGTKEGDIYSFAIITSEIATRDVPFGHERNSLSIFALLDLISDKDNPNLDKEREIWNSVNGDIIIRPKITIEQLPEGAVTQKKFKKMLEDIWCEDPHLRLPFQKLESIIQNIHPSKVELADNLINLLESYSRNLEQIVIERTNDMEIEKAKIDNIVGQMLPRHVVEKLKVGEKVPPETFENVTVFYSDIVGFTTIAKKSDPMQVVTLLNTLYGKFDSILAQYDVYKVETIGDAYVVSSGVPNRNGILHAGEIATASIDIVCTIMTVPIPHLPDDKLLLRMGIHSGSVSAGVVGLKMPRFALFGDTMQIASTMESSSKPLHIQVSKNTINILNELGGFFYKCRGDREVCGQTITTYWLIGKAGYDKVLPDVED